MNRRKPKKVCLLGSGALSIGQAGEFDYSGTQAIKALREEGIEIVLVNPNIATVQTNPIPGVKTYLYPVNVEWVTQIIDKERPDGIIAGFGGQTALNCLIELDKQGVLERYGVINYGTPVKTLELTEDRDLFAVKMKELGIPTPNSRACETLEQARQAAGEVGYPVIIRAAYALGGLGSGFANNDKELEELVDPALKMSPQVLVEKSLRGWKEVEYEVMRDSTGNTITICNMENFDPLGVHTGDSIVVTPSQTLNDEEYQKLRNASIKMINALGVIGECNAQFALDPESSNFYIIEVNARLSRSSALASKASGYPIAYIAAKVVLGQSLIDLKNPMTGITSAFYEPALDYVTVKMPRWDLSKFSGASRHLGSTMKSVGEIMAIGRSFPEAIQKAVRMVTESELGLLRNRPGELEADLDIEQPTDHRMFRIIELFRSGLSLEDIHQQSKIDKWFLHSLHQIIRLENELGNLAKKSNTVQSAILSIDANNWLNYKQNGFSDAQIAMTLLCFKHGTDPERRMLSNTTEQIRKRRLKFGVKPYVKKIDTTAAEYPSPSNYLYLSYHAQMDDELEANLNEGILVLGGGAYRIGASVEFDWCAVSCSQEIIKAGFRSVMINCNPETVSTDFNTSDHLFFEELSLERILDIAQFEQTNKVICSMGGQLPNQLSQPLTQNGLKLLGHSAETIDLAEDRSKFSKMLDNLKIDQPEWVSVTDSQQLDMFIEKVDFPVLIRPSYVLSGAAMKVAYDKKSLERFLAQANEISTDHPIVVSKFYQGAREIEIDGVANHGEIVVSIVSEHVENAGIHSGDATTVVPAQRLYVETVRQLKKATKEIAKSISLNGPFNIQFLAQNNHIKVIECNVRSARSFPFISKTVGLDLASTATKVMLGQKTDTYRHLEDELPHVGVKAAMFSFTRLKGADPVTGVEMTATGEVGCIAQTFEESFLLAMEATQIPRPKKAVLVSAGPEQSKIRFLEAARIIIKMGLTIYATPGTSSYFNKHGIKNTHLSWGEADSNSVLEAIRTKKVDMVCNIPLNDRTEELTRGSSVRQTSVQCGIPVMTDIEKMMTFFRSWEQLPRRADHPEPMPLHPYFKSAPNLSATAPRFTLPAHL